VRLVPEEMIVKRSYIDPVVQKCGHDWVDFFLKENEIAHHHVGTVTRFCEGDPAAEPEWCRRGKALYRYLQVVARNVHFQNARFEVSLSVQGLQDPLVVNGDILCSCRE